MAELVSLSDLFREFGREFLPECVPDSTSGLVIPAIAAFASTASVGFDADFEICLADSMVWVEAEVVSRACFEVEAT